jgi:hypothetical protein
MHWHLVWLWFWYFVGAFMFWLKRAYYGVTPPNPVANNYRHYIQRAWAPLLVRFFADSMVFWALFTPGFADAALGYLGWSRASAAVAMVTQYAVFSGTFGFVVDSSMDTVMSKLPWIKDVLPQMPGPMSTNVNITDAKLKEAKHDVDSAAEKLQGAAGTKP